MLYENGARVHDDENNFFGQLEADYQKEKSYSVDKGFKEVDPTVSATRMITYWEYFYMK